MTKLDDIKFACHCAAFEAIDQVLESELGVFKGKPVRIMDKHLPALIPALDRAIEAAMREVYDLMPESLSVDDATIAKSKEQMARSLAKLAELKRLGYL